MIVRRATMNDALRVIELGIQFGLESQLAHGLRISKERIQDFACHSIIDPSCIFLVLEDEGIVTGMIVAYALRSFFSDDLVLQELVWYIEKGKHGGIKLMIQMEIEAKKLGCQKVVVGCKPGYVDVSELYVKKGYRLMEAHYVKDI